jgi:hypothetical protein
VRDRTVEAAVRQGIEPIFERDLAASSYGFRPGRGGREAVARVEELLSQGHVGCVDGDLKSDFDTIPHDRLMAWVRERVVDGSRNVDPASDQDADRQRHPGRLGLSGLALARGEETAAEEESAETAGQVAAVEQAGQQGLNEIVAQMNPILRGWYGYFRDRHPSGLRGPDGWLRRRLRAMLRKREKRPGYGWSEADSRRWPNRWFAAHGLYGLEHGSCAYG